VDEIICELDVESGQSRFDRIKDHPVGWFDLKEQKMAEAEISDW